MAVGHAKDIYIQYNQGESFFKDQCKDKIPKDFACGPEVNNLPSNAGNSGLFPGWRMGTPHATG